jgi:hypothetical protein
MGTLIYWQDEATGAIGVVRLDAMQSESPEDNLTITSHPVEQGANVVDHAREEPTTLSVEGIVSSIPNPAIDTDAGFQTIEITVPIMLRARNQIIELDPPKPPLALSPSGLIQAGVTAIGSAIFGGPNMSAEFAGETTKGKADLKGQFYQQNSPRNRVRDVYDALLAVQSKRQFVNVSTRDREHFDMLIARVAKPRALEDGSSAKFQIDFQRIRVASSQTVAAPKPAEARGKAGTSKGAQAAKPDADPKQKRKTLAKAILDSLGS